MQSPRPVRDLGCRYPGVSRCGAAAETRSFRTSDRTGLVEGPRPPRRTATVEVGAQSISSLTDMALLPSMGTSQNPQGDAQERLDQRMKAESGGAQQPRNLDAAEAAVQQQIGQPGRVPDHDGQPATWVATRTASSRCAGGTRYSAATVVRSSPARNIASASSRRAPPLAKIGWPKPRAGSTTTSATS